MKVFCVSGYHHTGKTTVVISLIKALRGRGYTVSTIKDIHNEQFTMETEGSNTWQHWEASDNLVFARGLKETYLIWHKRLTLEEMLKKLDSDFVIIEGMKSLPLPKIICAENDSQLNELVDDTVFAVSGKFANKPENEYKQLPVLHHERDISTLTDLVIEKVLPILPYVDPECCDFCGLNCAEFTKALLKGERKRGECIDALQERLHLKINGKEIPMVQYVEKTLRDVITAYINNLKGIEKGEVEIAFNSE